MIIIDEKAERKLSQVLRDLPKLDGRYCLHFRAMKQNHAALRARITVEGQIFFPDSQLYVCDDGEMFLLTPEASLKDCRKLLVSIADGFGIAQVEHIGTLYELVLSVGHLLVTLENKIVVQRRHEELLKQQEAARETAAKASRRRQEILERGVGKKPDEIATQRARRSKPILMMIEDDPFSQRLVCNVLGKDYEIKCLDSANHALESYADFAPDMLFLDINLPDVTGHELLEKIMTLDPRAYVVMLSGNADRNNILQATQCGAVGFIAKPFSRAKLYQYIERCPTIQREHPL